MSQSNKKLPLGIFLQNAGLISSQQLTNALEIQSQYTQMKIGEILILQEEIKPQTLDFFVNKWREIKEQGQQFPIGYYLKQASLLDEQQIQAILTDQKQTKLKFGELAVKKGWLKQRTVNFFLNNLSIRPPQLISLIMLEQYNQDTLHLERKYANPPLILSRILAWSGGNPTLTKIICHVFANSNFNIPAGLESQAVDQFVEGSLIENWQTTKVGNYIRTVKENLVNNSRCDTVALLKEYREIILSGSKENSNTKEQEELLVLGLIVEEKNKLRVSNLIYQQIFNQDWTSEQIAKLQQIAQEKDIALIRQDDVEIEPSSVKDIEKHTLNNEQNQIDISEKEPDEILRNNTVSKITEPITKMSSLMTLAGIILLVPIILAVNNYYSLAKQEQKQASESLIEANKLKQFCREIHFDDPSSTLILISKLERGKQELLKAFPRKLEAFPDNCETALNKLRVLAAPQLGKEHRVFEALRHLCKIPTDSEVFVEAEVWLDHWYNSPGWGKQTKFYLQEVTKQNVSRCPAAHFANNSEQKK
ncbi:hypothetical protein [Pleurocapsa sp. PCC 7319]|uniref:hypothetical protein n=1 Tax=Pleurocapsa sp. PCC 7319 TaxID=118161 RepID=UPI000345FA02|nr:hypothetical protein [Pleurocapsa sp. PCC 7319]